MTKARWRTIRWTPTGNKEREGVGLEHLLLTEGMADSVVLAFDEDRGPFRLSYRLTWDETWQLGDAGDDRIGPGGRSRGSSSAKGWRWLDGPGQPLKAMCLAVLHQNPPVVFALFVSMPCGI